jgi:hypothetical protein
MLYFCFLCFFVLFVFSLMIPIYNKKHNSNVRYDEKKLHIPQPLMSSLFLEPIDNIVNCVKKCLVTLNGKALNCIILSFSAFLSIL